MRRWVEEKLLDFGGSDKLWKIDQVSLDIYTSGFPENVIDSYRVDKGFDVEEVCKLDTSGSWVGKNGVKVFIHGSEAESHLGLGPWQSHSHMVSFFVGAPQ